MTKSGLWIVREIEDSDAFRRTPYRLSVNKPFRLPVEHPNRPFVWATYHDEATRYTEFPEFEMDAETALQILGGTMRPTDSPKLLSINV